MQLSAEPVIYILIFVGVVVLVEGIYLVAFGKSIRLNNQVNRRLEMMEKGSSREQVLEQLRKELGQHGKSKTIPLYSILAEKAQKAAIAFSPKQLMMIMAGLATLAFFWLEHRYQYPPAPARSCLHRDWRGRRVLLGQPEGWQAHGLDRRTAAGCGGVDGAKPAGGASV